jgi:hypothetical protein
MTLNMTTLSLLICFGNNRKVLNLPQDGNMSQLQDEFKRVITQVQTIIMKAGKMVIQNIQSFVHSPNLRR